MVDPQIIIEGLMARGVPYNAAVALAGNMAVESRFDPGINEISPLVPGSRGGYGLMQWTGPRRRQYESFASDRGAPLDDLNAQLDFLTWELGNTERRAADAIYAAQTPDEAARLVSERFLRPGIPHLDRRIEETMRLAGGGMTAPSTNRGGNALSGPQTGMAASRGQTPPGNALAPPAPDMMAQQQQARRDQAFNALMQNMQQPIYDFKMAGGNALGGMF